MAAGKVSDIDIGTFLKIYSANGVYNNLSTASEMWKYFLKLRARNAEGRQLRYLLRTSYGPAAVQSVSAGTGSSYPEGQRSGLTEGTAEYKDFALTVNVPRSILNKRGSELMQYADPMTEEMDAKGIVCARILSAQTQGDGTGAIGKLASDATADTSNDKITITLSTASADAGRSHIGWFEEDDKVFFAPSGYDGSGTLAHDSSSGTSITGDTEVAYWKVTSVDEENDQVELQAYDSSDSLVGIDNTTINADDPSQNDLVYRGTTSSGVASTGTTPADIDAIVAGTTDYNTLTEVLTGLESLLADDGRVVNGVTHSGIVKGTRKDNSGAQIDSSTFQSALSKAKRLAGRGRYKYNKAFMFDTVYDALIEASETDRRFMSFDDGTRGFKRIGYQHGKDFVEFVPDEFVSKQRVWMPPESKEVLEFHGKDVELVEINPGQKFHLKNGAASSSHAREVQAYMEGSAVVIAKHPAACAVIENYAT